MKTILATSIAVLLLSGCGGNEPSETSAPAPAQDTKQASAYPPTAEAAAPEPEPVPEPPKEPEMEKVDVMSVDCYGQGSKVWHGMATDIKIQQGETSFLESVTGKLVTIYGDSTCVMDVAGQKTRQVTE